MCYGTPLWGLTPVCISIGSEGPPVGSFILTSSSIRLVCCFFSLKPVIRVCAFEPSSVQYVWQDPLCSIPLVRSRSALEPNYFAFCSYSPYPQSSTSIPLIGHPVGVLDNEVALSE